MKKFSVKQGDQIVLKKDHIALTEEGVGEPSDFAGYDKVKLPKGLKGIITFVGSNGSFDVVWDNMIHTIETVNKKEIGDVMRVAKKGKESHKDKTGRYERRPESEFKAGDTVMLIDPSSLGYRDGMGDFGTIVITTDLYGVESIHPEPSKDTVNVEWENGKIEPVFENKLVKVSMHYSKFDPEGAYARLFHKRLKKSLGQLEALYYDEYEATDGFYQVEVFTDGSFALGNFDTGEIFEGRRNDLKLLEDQVFADWIDNKLNELEQKHSFFKAD